MDFSEYCDKNQNITMQENRFSRNNEFSKNNANLHENSKKNGLNEQKSNQFYENDALKADIESKLSKYKNMNANQLEAELFREATKQKQNGNLNSEKLEEIKSTLLPMLNQEQQQRLDSLIQMLK